MSKGFKIELERLIEVHGPGAVLSEVARLGGVTASLSERRGERGAGRADALNLRDAGVKAMLQAALGMSKEEIDACRRLNLDPISLVAAGRCRDAADYVRIKRELRGEGAA